MNSHKWNRRALVCVLALFILLVSSTALADTPQLIWGVNPNAAGAELVNINPATGAVVKSFALPAGTVAPGNAQIGLAGWTNALYYIDGDVNAGKVYVLSPADGAVTNTFSISGGWGVNGLGYYSDGVNGYLYTSGCSVGDVHRYNAIDGSEPAYYWSNLYQPMSVAGDNGGRIFSYASVGGNWGIYELNPLTEGNASFFAASPSTSIVGMAYDGLYLYLSDSNNMLYTINNNGQLINTVELDFTLFGLGSTEGTGPAPVIPEPTTMVLLGSGLLGVASRIRRRK